jgi:hypothetical protein
MRVGEIAVARSRDIGQVRTRSFSASNVSVTREVLERKAFDPQHRLLSKVLSRLS